MLIPIFAIRFDHTNWCALMKHHSVVEVMVVLGVLEVRLLLLEMQDAVASQVGVV